MVAVEPKIAKDQGLVQDSPDRERGLSRREMLLRMGWTVPVVAMVMTPKSVFATGSVCDAGGDSWGGSCQNLQKHWAENQGVTLEIGGKDYYYSDPLGTKQNPNEKALAVIVGQNDPGNYSWYRLFREVTAAKVNRYVLNPPNLHTGIEAEIDQANALLTAKIQSSITGGSSNITSSTLSGLGDVDQSYQQLLTDLKLYCEENPCQL